MTEKIPKEKAIKYLKTKNESFEDLQEVNIFKVADIIKAIDIALKEQEKFIDALKYAYHKSLKQNKELYKRIEILEGYEGKSEKTLKERLANQEETIANQLKEIEKLSHKCTKTQGDKEC